MSGSDGQLSLQLVQPGSNGQQRTKARATGLPRLAVTPEEAAQMLGVSRDFFDEHIKPELRIIRRGPKKILIPLRELDRWIDQNASRWTG